MAYPEQSEVIEVPKEDADVPGLAEVGFAVGVEGSILPPSGSIAGRVRLSRKAGVDCRRKVVRWEEGQDTGLAGACPRIFTV